MKQKQLKREKNNKIGMEMKEWKNRNVKFEKSKGKKIYRKEKREIM